MINMPLKIFFGTAMGSIIEFYDYYLFVLLLPFLAPLFFPGVDAYQALSKSYIFLFAIMFARPLGGIAFGHIGDMFGRRTALLSSMYGIALATLVIGLTPTYATIGITSTIIVITAKAAQTFCFGGEYNGAGIYVVEHVRNHNEAFAGCLVSMTTSIGSLLASFAGLLIAMNGMPSWCWRIAFLLGSALGFLAIFYRKNFIEPPNFTKADRQKQNLLALFKEHPKELLASIFVGAFVTVPVTTIFVFIDPVLMAKQFINHQQLMLMQTFLILVIIATLIPASRLADKKTPYYVMRIGCWSLAIFSYPLMYLVDSHNIGLLLFGLIGLCIINEIFVAPTNAYLKNLFPMQFRYRGSSLGFCLGMAIFGGLTPVIENYIYQTTGSFQLITLWLIFIAITTGLILSWIEKEHVIAALDLA